MSRLDDGAILDLLDAGRVVLLATDTVPGLHARLDRPAALAAMQALKGRQADKPFLVLAPSLERALDLAAAVPSAVRRFLASCWPGPFTAVLPAGDGLPPAVLGSGTVAIRVPAWPALRALLAACGPLASSSANLAGRPPPTDLAAAQAVFPKLSVWSSEPIEPAGGASAVVDLTGALPALLRAGPSPLPPWDAGGEAR